MNLLIERRALNYQTPHPVKESNPARQVLEARPYPVPKAGLWGYLGFSPRIRLAALAIASANTYTTDNTLDCKWESQTMWVYFQIPELMKAIAVRVSPR